MKSRIAFAIAALLASGSAFAQDAQPTGKKGPAQVAQAGAGGASNGAGEATGAASAGLSAGAIVAIGAGVALVVAASGSRGSDGGYSTVYHH